MVGGLPPPPASLEKQSRMDRWIQLDNPLAPQIELKLQGMVSISPWLVRFLSVQMPESRAAAPAE